MTDHDGISRRYRELAREEPSVALDSAILAKARGRTPGARPRFSMQRWAGPMSIAAVLVLGIGVSLRMQLERPGIETSTPAGESAAPSEYQLPPSADSALEPPAAVDAAKASQAPPAAADEPKPVQAPPARQNRQDAARAPRPFADGPLREPSRSEPVWPQAVPAAPLGGAATPSALPAPEPARRAAPPPAAARAKEAPAAAQSAPMRSKLEKKAMDSLGAGGLLKSVAPETDAHRELERIAKLREEGNHAEADKALAELRRRHPDFRIPEVMWERVKPR